MLDRVLDAAASIIIGGDFAVADLETIASKAGTTVAELLSLFDTREQLLVAMLNREYGAMYASILDNIERDPRGGLLSRIYLYTLTAVYERPLAKALYTTDRETLNTMMRSPHGFAYVPKMGVRAGFIEDMQAAGMVRRDVDAAALSYVLSTFSAGLALTAPHDDLDAVIRGICDLLSRSADADVTDTGAGKVAFYDYATSLASSM
jgi:AcrR family transcriptional regulator